MPELGPARRMPSEVAARLRAQSGDRRAAVRGATPIAGGAERRAEAIWRTYARRWWRALRRPLGRRTTSLPSSMTRATASPTCDAAKMERRREERRAMELLREHLDEHQRADLDSGRRCFYVTGGVTGTRYQISAYREANVLDLTNRVQLCSGLRDIPLGDHLLAQVLMLQGPEEERFLDTAVNWPRSGSAWWPGIAFQRPLPITNDLEGGSAVAEDSMTLEQMQAQVAAWHREQFGDIAPVACTLKLMSEVGELADIDCNYLETAVGVQIRDVGTRTAETADILITLLGYCDRAGVNLQRAFMERWPQIAKRDYRRGS